MCTSVSRLCVLIGLYVLWNCGSDLIVPHVNLISINYFASVQAGGRTLDCGIDTTGNLADACRVGNDASTAWSAGSSFLANAVLGICTIPLCGHLSDQFGRKPFLLAGVPAWEFIAQPPC